MLVQSRAGLEGRFDGRSGLHAVGVLDVAATVIFAGSPARELFSVDEFGDVRDEVLIFFPVLNVDIENHSANEILIAIARPYPQAVGRACVNVYFPLLSLTPYMAIFFQRASFSQPL